MTIAPAHSQAFIVLAFDQMMTSARSVAEAGRLSDRPDLDGANSVYALVTHCVGVTDFWLDHVVAGNDTTRDRDAEFVAAGTLDELESTVGALLDRLSDLLEEVESRDEPAKAEFAALVPWPWSCDTVVLHVIEELFQHAGHVDLTADLLLVR